VKTYRCKHTVEALRWTDTDADRTAFSDWFDGHGVLFETVGPIVLLPDISPRDEGDHNRVEPGEWVVWMDGEFVAMGDEEFADTYEVVAS
jgi:hypothetical protein